MTTTVRPIIPQDQSQVFTVETTYIDTPCPPWCDLKPMHPVDNGTGVPALPDFRIHGDLDFGDCLFGYGEEYVDAPGVLRVKVDLKEVQDINALQLRQLSDDAKAAAEWLEAQA